MEQNHIPDVGQIILVTYNNRIEPAIVCRQDPQHNQVLVTFINHLVTNSQMNYREQFGPNILMVANANNYIPYDLENALNYTFFNNFNDLQRRYQELLEQINTGHLMLNRLGVEGGQQKLRKSRVSIKRRIKRSRQRK